MLSRKLFAEKIQALAELFEKELSKAMLELYYDSVSSLSDEDFTRCCVHLVRTSKFFPRPADFVSSSNEDSKLGAMSAWRQVLQAISAHGRYRSVAFADARINAAVRYGCGSWVRLCHADVDSMPFQERDFCAAYERLSGRRIDASDPVFAYLPGEEETADLARGLSPAPPVLVGPSSAEAKQIAEEAWQRSSKASLACQLDGT